MLKYDKIMNYGSDLSSPLVQGENLIWSAKPKKSTFIINNIVAMMPFALLWLAFDSFFIITMIATGEIKQMLFFVIPFFALHLMPVWIWLGNIITAGKKWKNTEYYVTDKRIILKTGVLGVDYQSVYYKDIRNVNLRVGMIDKLLGVGDIYFDNINRDIAFLDIENPYEIYPVIQKTVLDMQTDIEYPNAFRPDYNPGYNTEYKG